MPIVVGATEVSRTTVGRLVTLTLHSTALERDQPVNVLLPEGYEHARRRRYPVVYLLHGAGGDYTTWLDTDGIADALGRLPVIAVMPEGSGTDAHGVRRNGGYSDWFGTVAGGPPPAFAWESYHLRELVPFIDAHFRTRATPGGRAVLGISMGGTGAMKYAAANPGTFGYAGSLSGGLDSWPFRFLREQNCVDGDPASEEVVWHDDNPTDLAPNLGGVRLFVRAGDGTPGPFDAPTAPSDPGQALIWKTRLATEAGANVMAHAFVSALGPEVAARADVAFYPGSHSHPYWQREAAAFVAWFGRELRRPVRAPRAFTVATARPAFTAWDWHFVADRMVREFAYVAVEGGTVVVTGSGHLSVSTPPRYRAGRSYRVRIDDATRTVVAGTDRRLVVTLDLGPSHTVQQTAFDAAATAGWSTARLRIPAAR